MRCRWESFRPITYDGFRELNAKLLTGEDIAPVREQNREAQGLYAMVSIRDEAGRSHGYMAVVLSMDATIAFATSSKMPI